VKRENEVVIRVSAARSRNTHHIWNNNGVWFVHYTLHTENYQKVRVRRSLRTKDLATAIKHRDELFGRLLEVSDESDGNRGGAHCAQPLAA